MTTPLNIRTFCKCDGVTDDLPGLQKAIAAAKAEQRPILIPAYNQLTLSDVATLDAIEMYGELDASTGAPLCTLFSTNPKRAAIFLRGAGAKIRDLKMDGTRTTVRGNQREDCRVVARDAIEFEISGLTVLCSGAAGLRADNSTGAIRRNHVCDTLADSIHHTAGTNNVVTEDNTIERAGDDSISVVSYLGAPICHDIMIRHNTVRDSKANRCISIVGGDRIMITENVVRDAPTTAIFVVTEHNSDWQTERATNVTVLRNTVVNVGGPAHTAAMMVFSDTPDRKVENIVLDHNVIRANPGNYGIRFSKPNSLKVSSVENMIEVTQKPDANGKPFPPTPIGINDPANTTVVQYNGGPVGCPW